MLRHENIKRMFRSSLVVIIIASITGTIGMLVDGILIGRYLGSDALAAYGLISPAFLILHAVGGVFSSGMQALCAGYMGKGKLREANGVFTLTTVLTIGISVIFAAGMALFADPIAAFLGAKGDAAALLPMARDYLVGLSFGLPMILLHQCLQPIMQLDGDKGKVIVSTLVMTVADVVGDLLVVHVFEGGMLGMALTTSVSYLVSMLVYLPHFFRKSSVYRFRLSDVQWSETLPLLSTGLPTALSRFCNTLRSLLLNHLLLALAGSVAVTALSAQSNMNNFFSSISTGISMSTLLVVGVLYGEEDRDGIRSLLQTALRYGAVLVSIAGAVLGIFAPQFVSLYIQPDDKAYAMAVECVRIFAFSMPLHALNNVFINYLQGTRNLKRSHLVCAMNELLAIIASAYVLGNLFGVRGVWMAFPVGKLLTLVTVFVLACISEKRLPKSTGDFLFLPKTFDSTPSREVEVHSASDLQTLAEAMEDMTAELEYAAVRRSLGAVSDVVEDVFQEAGSQKAPLCVDVRMRVEDDHLRIRIRDNGPAKDRSLALQQMLKGTGELKYSNTMDTNYLYLTYKAV